MPVETTPVDTTPASPTTTAGSGQADPQTPTPVEVAQPSSADQASTQTQVVGGAGFGHVFEARLPRLAPPSFTGDANKPLTQSDLVAYNEKMAQYQRVVEFQDSMRRTVSGPQTFGNGTSRVTAVLASVEEANRFADFSQQKIAKGIDGPELMFLFKSNELLNQAYESGVKAERARAGARTPAAPAPSATKPEPQTKTDSAPAPVKNRAPIHGVESVEDMFKREDPGGYAAFMKEQSNKRV